MCSIRAVLNLLHLKQNPRRRVQWINLREEPVVYVNSRPFVLRELEQPFANMSDFQGQWPRTHRCGWLWPLCMSVTSSAALDSAARCSALALSTVLPALPHCPAVRLWL